ncbi:hypothetical protein G5B40_17320 [Pikeienuella piscinae]|uniref:Uncharacterized protein n=1 Tax=Pikeienuella piscinae TaxID=2748098 RepID=A0A7L5C427_9RHOB|nr:hypothetical protein [Pikeienuella piscinae]QIE57044.1 hypothetical protein G5B40_17320 [Pikeienuella piscinae]
MANEQDINAATIEIARPEALRWMLFVALIVLAVACGAVGSASFSSSPLTAGFMALSTIGLLLLGRALFLTDAARLIFDGERLVDDSGAEICRLDEIERIERGFAFFKPSSGFVLKLTEPRPRGWSPGLWWRLGRRVGVGGATPSRAGRHMADALSGALAMRSGA